MFSVANPKFTKKFLSIWALESLLKSTLSMAMSGEAMAPPREQCTLIPANEPDAPVEVCETLDSYKYRIHDEIKMYRKADYRHRISSLIHDYFSSQGLPDHEITGATVTFWLSVPEAAPADAWARAIVSAPKFHFLVNLPIDLDVEHIQSGMVANLGAREYPDYLGHRVGSILAKKSPDSREGDFRAAVVKAGATGWIESAGGWTSFSTRAFDEVALISRILQDAEVKPYVASAQVNEIFEWIAWRAPVFRFRMN